MKIAASDNIIERSGIDNEKSFSIKASGKAFKILSDGLYSNKIGAVIRELSCNAYDAHVAAKKENIPFEIHLPTSIEPWFSVKDFGIGLDHDEVIHLYSTYFESTKNQSNDFVGAFGLGSKSPFSYVESFTVTSFYNGMKRCYTAFISEDGTPKISMFHEAETTESNGIEVQVPVKGSDFSSFNSNAKTYLRHFKPLPKLNIPDFDFGVKEPTLSGTGWRYYADQRYQTKVFLIQGNVGYPVDSGSFNDLTIPNYMDSIIRRLSLEIDFNIGDLDVAASREALSYDKRTTSNIIDKLKSVYEELEVAFASKILSFTGTEWEKQIQIKEFKSTNRELFELFDSDNKLIKDFKFDFTAFNDASLKIKSTSWRNNKKFSVRSRADYEFYILHAVEDAQIFVNDVERPITWFKNHIVSLNKSWRDTEIFVIYPGNHNIKSILDSIGNPPYKMTSEIVKPPKVDRTPRDTNLYHIAIPDSTHIGYWSCSSLTNSGGSDVLPEEGLYLEMDRSRVNYNNQRLDNYDEILRKARNMKLFENSGYKKIYTLKKSQMKILAKKPKWINAIDFVNSQLDNWFNSNKEAYFKYIEFNSNKFRTAAEHLYNMIKQHPDYAKIKGSALEMLLKTYDDYSAIKVDSDAFPLIRSIGYTPDITGITLPRISDLNSLVNQKYPLIKFTTDCYSSIENSTADAVINYIQLIDSKESLTKD